jgi:hypothetical protein
MGEFVADFGIEFLDRHFDIFADSQRAGPDGRLVKPMDKPAGRDREGA